MEKGNHAFLKEVSRWAGLTGIFSKTFDLCLGRTNWSFFSLFFVTLSCNITPRTIEIQVPDTYLHHMYKNVHMH